MLDAAMVCNQWRFDDYTFSEKLYSYVAELLDWQSDDDLRL